VTGAVFAFFLVTLSASAATAQSAGTDDLSRLRSAHRANPDDPVVGRELGLLLYQRDNASPEARRLLEAASTRFPERHDVHLALLDSHLAAQDEAAAAALLDRIQPRLDADERFALDATYILLGRRRFPEARDQWSRVARRVQEALQRASGATLTPAEDEELKRRVAEVLFIQGLLTARLGDKAEALQLLEQADGYGFPPLDSPLMMAAADCLQELQEYTLATQAYREVIERAPKNAEARLRLGAALYASGQIREAGEEIERVLRQNPDHPRANYLLGAILLEQKRTHEAQAHLERELARDEGCARCMSKLAHIAYLEGDDDACASWLTRARALDPEDLEASLVSGMLDARAGRYDAAIRHLSQVVERSPSSPQARYQLALAYQRSGDAEKAREHREIYRRLIREQKARTIGVRGTED
jgi:tetratricopeptide (TPR) repeat protein